MNRIARYFAAAAIITAVVIAACAGRGTQGVVSEPRLTAPPSYENPLPKGIPTVPPGAVTEFPIPTASSFPTYITSAGGDLWFTENSANQIGRITTAGAITEFTVGTATGPYDIITGPDGHPWFAALTAAALGRVGFDGHVTVVPLPAASGQPSPHPEQIVADRPNKSIWFTDHYDHRVGVYSLTTKSITEYNLPAGIAPTGIALDNAGNVWFSDFRNDQVDEMSNTGTLLQQLTLPGSSGGSSLEAWYMTLGKDGNLYLTELSGGPNFTGAVARINPTTLAINTFVPRGANPQSAAVATGPKGIWMGPEGANQLVRLSYAGTFKEWVIPGSFGYGIVEGPDKNMWYVDFNANAIVQVKVSLLP